MWIISHTFLSQWRRATPREVGGLPRAVRATCSLAHKGPNP